MYMLLGRILRAFCRLRWKYLLSGSIVLVQKGAVFEIGEKTKIKKCRLSVAEGATVKIGNRCLISGAIIRVYDQLYIGDFSIIEKGRNSINPFYIIEGKCVLSHHIRLRCNIWIRYGGILRIGEYTNMNEGGEIRVDEQVNIGSFNQISYEVMIWDTNTHNIYSKDERRKLAINKWPSFGYEYERLKTAPVSIGNDCWIGREVVVLKGTIIEDCVIIGFRTLLSGCHIDKNCSVVQEMKIRCFINKI